MTNDLLARVDQHKKKLVKGFTSRYSINKLVYFETCEEVESVILREKQIKSWPRKGKVELVNTMNLDWHDLSQDLVKG
jgi:putative endonuclease